ncbi:MBL fold metallo-hydrolase, partial [Rhizobiaceae sp. 2RAB30]
DWSGTLDAIGAFQPVAIVPGRGAALEGRDKVAEAIGSTRDFVTSTYRPAAAVAAKGGSLRDAWGAVRESCDDKFSS